MYSVLIADDEKNIREGIKYLLDWESLDFSITAEAATGDQALREILQNSPDVVLMDICMPGMLGLEVVRRVREEGYHGKIIILSGYSDFNYAKEAIRYGVQDYLTKPIDEDILQESLLTIRKQLDASRAATDTSKHYRQKAYDAIIRDLLLGNTEKSHLNLEELHLNASIFQVAIYTKYRHNTGDSAYCFSDLLRVTNQDNNSYDNIILDNHEVLLLKGEYAIQKFNNFLECSASPLDSLFITYGRCVTSLEEIHSSYQEAKQLLSRRFFCQENQHTIGYSELPPLIGSAPVINDELLEKYVAKLLNYIQSFNRNMLAETLQELQALLYDASDPIDSIKLFLTDMFLRIKEQMNLLYSNSTIPSPSNADIIRTVEEKFYLYEILRFFTEQFEVIMSSIGNFTRDSVLDDILHYINHNYVSNITLESIAPLFGYNSSYLGKIFSKRMGENFNSYVDHIRIEKSKELLLNEDIKVYSIAEKVGYRNVDYFHIKFKKYVGQSPAEFRKKNRGT